MRTAVIGVFDDPQAATRARDELLAAGLAERRVHLHVNDASDVASADATGATNEADSGAGALGEIFSSLFDLDGSDQRTGRLADAMRSGGFLVVAEDPGADRARITRILQTCGSIEVGEHSY